jgi:hypothetical protein
LANLGLIKICIAVTGKPDLKKAPMEFATSQKGEKEKRREK